MIFFLATPERQTNTLNLLMKTMHAFYNCVHWSTQFEGKNSHLFFFIAPLASSVRRFLNIQWDLLLSVRDKIDEYWHIDQDFLLVIVAAWTT
jgi:hypothetical protein